MMDSLKDNKPEIKKTVDFPLNTKAKAKSRIHEHSDGKVTAIIEVLPTLDRQKTFSDGTREENKANAQKWIDVQFK